VSGSVAGLIRTGFLSEKQVRTGMKGSAVVVICILSGIFCSVVRMGV